jgi:hypothetical protein
MNDDFDARLAIEEWNGAWDADPLDPPTTRAEASVILDMLSDALDDSGRAVLALIRDLGDKAFKCNGTLNVNRIAVLTRRPQRTLARRIDAIKNSAQVMGL